MSGLDRGVHDKAGRLGHMARLLALLAVVVQLFVPALALRSLPSPGGDDFAALLDAGLICHGAGGERQEKSDQPAGPPPHHALCCPWHGNASPVVPAPIAVEPARFFDAEVAFAAPAPVFLAARPQGDPRARAPPTGT